MSNLIERLKAWYYKKFGDQPTCDADGCGRDAIWRIEAVVEDAEAQYACWVHQPSENAPLLVGPVTWEDYEL